MSFTFEKNKLYAYLSKDMVEIFKKYKVYVAGGTITSLFSNREINDIDVYFPNEKSLINFLREMDEDGVWFVSHTKKATLFKYTFKDNPIEVQAIHFDYFDTPEALFNTFDYTACMGCYDFGKEEFVLHDDFLKHNSQRILKFNPNTAYPIVSLLRVQKYEEKGYKISKTEFIRIALTCMDLTVNSYEELKDHLGGMYGENFDKMFSDIEDEEFNLRDAIDKLANLALSEDYFNQPEVKEFDIDEMIRNISKEPVVYMNINAVHYMIGYDGLLEKTDDKPENHVEITAEKYFSENKFYKNVKKIDEKYFSFYNKGFEYKICDQVVASNEGRNNGKLHFVEKSDLDNASYDSEKDKSVLEVLINPDDFISANDGTVHAKKCYVVREVPKDEYEKWNEDMSLTKAPPF